ncbi:MAG: EAL domain-containing protein [Halofilum sp. (in: g-proteobacteria)]
MNQQTSSVELDERHYRALISASATFVWRCSSQGALTDVDRSWLELVGLKMDQARDLGWLSAVHPHDRDDYHREWIEALREGQPFEREYRLLCADGEVRWFLDRAIPIRQDDGQLVEWIGIGQEITAHKQAERDLERQRERYRTLVESTMAILWEGDPDTFQFTFVSGESQTLLGYTPQRWTQERDFWINHIHPEDRDWAPNFCAVATREGRQHTFDYRIIAADGSIVWLRDVVSVILDNGRPSKLVGVMIDITESKEAEQEARRLADRLYTTLESITDAFFTVDPDWRFTYVNGEAERLLQRCRADLLDKVLWEEIDGITETPIEQGIRRAAREHATVTLEEFYAPGEFWLEIHIYPSDEGLAVYFRDVSDRKRAEADVQFLALYDPLTQLPNRRLATDRLQHALASSHERGTFGAVAFLDVDDFKTLNDTLGHPTGDELLQKIASRLSEQTPESATVARFGGDEFLTVLPDLDSDFERAGTKAHTYGKEILDALNRPYRLNEHNHYATVSIGVTTFGEEHADTVHDILQRADLAMYRAKDEGRSSVRLFEPNMRVALSRRVALETELRQAIDRDEIVPYFQPLVDHAGTIIGAEALARWKSPLRGVVSPGEFIPVAEQTGMILPLGQAMLWQTCRQIAAWSCRDTFRSVERISVNISAHQFHQRDFVDQVRQALQECRADPGRLRLELTESFLLQDFEGTITKMNTLKTEGVTFSLDDFGTGYSSLAYLKRLPLDQIKIDQGFVRELRAGSHDAAIVEAIVLLANNLDLEVVAEGVENESIRDLLSAYGCHRHQGYWYSPPLPLDEFETYVTGVNATT